MKTAANHCIVTGGVLAVLSVALPVLAHHSTALFDQSQVLSQPGTISAFEWTNPHAWLHVDITDESGAVTTWSFEGGNTGQLTQLGWNRDDFAQGIAITVGFRPMRDGSRGGQLMSVTLPDGRQVCSNRGCN